jgi:hypothetical protein
MTQRGIRAAAYARVSSDGQVKGNTIASQLEALAQRVNGDGFELDPELRFVDDGYSGSTLVARPWSGCATRRRPAASTGSTSTRPTGSHARMCIRCSWSTSRAGAASS